MGPKLSERNSEPELKSQWKWETGMGRQCEPTTVSNVRMVPVDRTTTAAAAREDSVDRVGDGDQKRIKVDEETSLQKKTK